MLFPEKRVARFYAVTELYMYSFVKGFLYFIYYFIASHCYLIMYQD